MYVKEKYAIVKTISEKEEALLLDIKRRRTLKKSYKSIRK